MNLNLFSREHVHSNLSYEENLKLKPLLQSFCDGISEKLILELFSFYGDAGEILKRQEFFREICENESSRNLLKKIRVFYRPVESAVAYYNKQPGLPEKDIWGINLLEQYVSFVENVVAEKHSSGSRPGSELFRTLYGQMEEITASGEFAALKENLRKAEEGYGKIREINLITCYHNSLISSYEIGNNREESFQAKQEKMLSQLGIETDNKLRLSSDDVDLYERYSRYIVEKFPELMTLLRRINKEYEQLLDVIASGSIKDVCIALACCEFHDFLRDRGIALCYPAVSKNNALRIKNAKDISLLLQKEEIVPNDIDLSEKEKVVFISGANGGGKTSFVRAIGICNIMFSCGLFVPAAAAELGIWDNIFTMFPHKEQLSERGRFVTEKRFFETVMEKATSESLLLANEMFSSTNEATALEQFRILINDIEKKGGRVFFVTHFTQVIRSFQDENYPVFSCKMQDDAVTFKVVRAGAHSSSVTQILEKYGLTKLQLKEKFQKI